MKVLFKNTTKYDKENRNNLINFHYDRYAKLILIKYALLILCAVYISIFNIINKNWYALCLVLLAVIFIYFLEKYKETTVKKEKKTIGQYNFYFYKNYIKIKHRKQYNRILYFNVKKVFETEKNFFLYTDETHSLILDKEGFTLGTSEEFAKFIKNKCIFRYSNQIKK